MASPVSHNQMVNVRWPEGNPFKSWACWPGWWWFLLGTGLWSFGAVFAGAWAALLMLGSGLKAGLRRVAPGCGESSTQHELFNSSKRWCLRLSNYIIKLYYISILVVVLYEFGNTFLGKVWWPELCNVESFTCGDTSHVWRSLVFRVLQWF